MRDEGKSTDVARLRPRGVACQDQVDKRHIPRTSDGGLGCGVLEGDCPFGKVSLEEVDKVVEDLGGAVGAWDAGYENGREEGTGVDVKVGTRRWEVFQSCIGERGVCCGIVEEESDEDEEDG